MQLKEDKRNINIVRKKRIDYNIDFTFKKKRNVTNLVVSSIKMKINRGKIKSDLRPSYEDIITIILMLEKYFYIKNSYPARTILR